jgi:ATP-dependent DNA helicase RecQ
LTRKADIPAFVIFGDKSLRDMARIKPTTREAFTTVYGVRDYKLHAYADAFIEVIKNFLHLGMA